jgi:hypothetical protein
MGDTLLETNLVHVCDENQDDGHYQGDRDRNKGDLLTDTHENSVMDQNSDLPQSGRLKPVSEARGCEDCVNTADPLEGVVDTGWMLQRL